MKVLAYLGPKGSFSEDAAIKFGDGFELEKYTTVYAALRSTQEDATDCALLPLENALGGTVAEVEDYLLDKNNELVIVSEYLLKIDLHLIGKVDDLKSVRAVRSKAEAFRQCRKFLHEYMPNASLEPWHSTSGAVASIATGDAPSGTVAIASKLSIEGRDLPIIKHSIQDRGALNLTRFVMLRKNATTAPTDHSKTSIAFSFKESDSSGQLSSVLNVFATSSINLTKLASRPTRKMLGSYYFWVDFMGHKDSPKVKSLLDEVKSLTAELKVLGSYPIHKA